MSSSGSHTYAPASYTGWENYAGTKDGLRYSSNTQINTNNVHKLKIAWRYSSHDKDSLNRSQNQCNPIVIDGILYGVSPKLKLLALDAVTGEERWVFDPALKERSEVKNPMQFFKISRGLSYWQNKNGTEKRIFHNVGNKIYCIDVDTGRPDERFGDDGCIDLSKEVNRNSGSFNLYVGLTTPGIIYNNLLITGARVSEAVDAAPGHIKAYDVRTGEQKWIFHTIPHPGEVGYDTWPDKDAYRNLGGANCWAGMSLDEERGIVYVPTGSVSGDFYGGTREGQNLFANSLIALEASTGKYIWHYQTVHHDLWDRDLPANPNLVTLRKNGKLIDAIAQITKHGFVYIFDRITGEPLFPIEEIPVPQTALPGEKPWPTQPIPTLPEPFARQHFGEGEVTDLTPETHKTMLARYRQIKHAEMFAPPSKEGSWIFPGFDGGGEWGGAAIDPESQILYVNCSELPWAMVMVDVPKMTNEEGRPNGRAVYSTYCIACHGVDMKGSTASFPSLVDIALKYSHEEISQIIDKGINMMPSFGQIPPNEKLALENYLIHNEEQPAGSFILPERNNQAIAANEIGLTEVPFTMTGYNRFLDDAGYPGITPPWGTLNAVDLISGKLLWKVPLGEYPELTQKGIPPTGTENYGGSVVTKGGLVFIAATKDSKMRAFDKKTGKLLWQAELSAPGYATPSVYSVNGKQFIVIACGGGKIGSPSGDEYIAFSLPD